MLLEGKNAFLQQKLGTFLTQPNICFTLDIIVLHLKFWFNIRNSANSSFILGI